MAYVTKYKFLLLAFALLVFAYPSYAQKSFEGSFVFEITQKGETQKIKSYSKDGMWRMEPQIEGQNIVMIYDSKNKKMDMIMGEQKMYMEMQFDDMDMEDDSEDMKDADINIDKTGEKKDIMGYAAEKWIIKSENNVTEAWVTDELGSFMFPENPMDKKNNMGDWANAKELMGKFPLQMTVKEEGGETTTLNVTDIKKGGVTEDMFTVPDGYMKMDMPMMNKGQH